MFDLLPNRSVHKEKNKKIKKEKGKGRAGGGEKKMQGKEKCSGSLNQSALHSDLKPVEHFKFS